MRLSLLAMPILLITGCANSPDTRTAEAQSPAQVCVREYRVGSNIPVVNCSTPQSDEERQRTIDEIRNGVRPNPGVAAKGGAGS